MTLKEATLWVRVPYSDSDVAALRTIPGRHWHADPGEWSFPATSASREALRGAFGSRLRYRTPELLPLERALELARYSPRTRRAYRTYNRLLLIDVGKSPRDVGLSDLEGYLLAASRRVPPLRAASHNLIVSAFRFFYGRVLRRSFARALRRVKNPRRLPPVLSRTETATLLFSLANPKHRALLSVAYSAGLRVSELVRLRWEDIDHNRALIRVRSGKGRKDRSALLSDRVREVLVIYRATLPATPRGPWLFPGQDQARHLTARSAQRIFKKAAGIAGITKDVSIHDLRHAFATHLLESGVSLPHIQTLLGHSSLRATEVYTHVARADALLIRSPLDALPRDASAPAPRAADPNADGPKAPRFS